MPVAKQSVPPPLNATQAAVLAVANSLERPEPPFDFEIRSAPDFDALLRGEHTVTKENELLDQARRHGRLLIQADGGAGKTSLLHRLFVRAMDSSIPILVDLRRWRARQLHQWDPFDAKSSMVLEVALGSLATPNLDVKSIPFLATATDLLLLVDGLNDLTTATAQSLLQALDEFAKQYPSSAVVVTDRLLRRVLPSSRWQLATMAIRDDYIDRTLANNQPQTMRPLLRLAFFLNWALKRELTAQSSAQAFHNFYGIHVGLSEPQMNRAGRAALQMYQDNGSRTFRLQEFSNTAGDVVTHLLQEAGVIVGDPDETYFEHHLLHDYLASRAAAVDTSLWKRSMFDVITLGANSFDVLALLLEQIGIPEEADLFISEVYDWNFYASAYALAKLESPEGAPVSSEMQRALVANLAEKRWDTFRMTAQRVEDSLHLFQAEGSRTVAPSVAATIAPEMLSISDVDALRAAVKRQQFRSDRLERWKQLFTQPANSSVDESHFAQIAQADPLIGWTTSNLLKRARLKRDQVTRLENMLAFADDPTVRWRAAHSLGSHGSRHTVTTLMKALDDHDQWVRYGAVRSLLECAALQVSLRRTVVRGLLSRIPAIRATDRVVLDEMATKLILRTPSTAWVEAIAPLLERLWVSAVSIEEQDYWRRLAFDLSRSVELDERAS